MRIMHFGVCVGCSLVAFIAFALTSVLGSFATASATPVWTQGCTVQPREDHVRLLCGIGTPTVYLATAAPGAWVMKGVRPAMVTCAAYRTHGFKLNVVCT